jgi:hypothetical protein
VAQSDEERLRQAASAWSRFVSTPQFRQLMQAASDKARLEAAIAAAVG